MTELHRNELPPPQPLTAVPRLPAAPELPRPDFTWPTALSFPKSARWFWQRVPGHWPQWARVLGYIAAVYVIATVWYFMAGVYCLAWWVIVPYQLIRNGQRRKEYEAQVRGFQAVAR